MSRFVMPLQSAFGQRAVPFDGAKLHFFDTGTSNRKNTFSDEALTTPNANPVVADANGLFPAIFLGGGKYKVQLKDKNGVAAGFGEEDPVERSLTSGNSSIEKDTVAAMVADTSLSVGDIVVTSGYTAVADGGGNKYEVVAAATGTNDGGSFINLATHQAKALWNGNTAHVLQYGIIGDGSVDDTTQWTALLASGLSFVADPAMSIKVGGNFTITADTDIKMRGARIKVNTSVAVAVNFLSVGARCDIDNLWVDVPTALTIHQGVEFTGADTVCGSCEVISIDQQANSATESAGIRVIGSDVSIYHQTTDNLDNSAIWRGDNHTSWVTDFQSYRRALWMDSPDNCSFGLIKSHVRSPNSVASAGENGVLMQAASNLSGKQIRVFNAGEHGVRFGGNPGCTKVRIGQVYAELSGSTGVKFRCSSASLNEDIVIDSIVCIDSGDPTAPISNQEGLTLHRVHNAHIGYVEVRKEANAKSCHEGVVFYNLDQVTIGAYNIQDTNNDMFNIITDDVDDASAAEIKDINEVAILGGVASGIDRHGVLLTIDGGDIRRLHFAKGCQVASVGSDLIAAQGSGAGSFIQDSIFEFFCSTITGTPVSGAKLNANVILNLTCPHTAVTAVAKGSRWHDLTTNDYLIKDSAGTWRALNT